MNNELQRICARRAAIFRELADLELEFARVTSDPEEARAEPDAVLSLEQASGFMGEPASTFRRRGEYAKALVSRPSERRRRYSRAVLERIKGDRLESNGMGS